MKPTLISRTAPAWLSDLTKARNDYEELFGWPVALHVTARRLTIPVGQLFDAMSMPAALGASVQRQLRIMLQDGPVIVQQRTGWLTFLTGLSASIEPPLPADLDRAGVKLIARGGHVVLPTACVGSESGEVRWFNPPRPRRTPPPWSVVIGASRWVVSRQAVDQSTALPYQRAA